MIWFGLIWLLPSATFLHTWGKSSCGYLNIHQNNALYALFFPSCTDKCHQTHMIHFFFTEFCWVHQGNIHSCGKEGKQMYHFPWNWLHKLWLRLIQLFWSCTCVSLIKLEHLTTYVSGINYDSNMVLNKLLNTHKHMNVWLTVDENGVWLWGGQDGCWAHLFLHQPRC